MKKVCFILVLTALAFYFNSCSHVDIDFNDPQEIEFIQDEFMYEKDGVLTDNNDLVELFGEENINFGPVPPTWNNDICFIVDGMDYVTCIRYIYDTYHNDENTLAHTDPPIYDASINIHLFQNHEQCVFKQQIKTHDQYGSTYTLDLDRTYIIGHDSLFTTYYKGKISGNGNPTVAMIISGTMVYDPITGEFKGVRDYIYGKKILDYEYKPTNAYAPGTILIKKHPGLSPKYEWDDR